MIETKELFLFLKRKKIEFFCGVPDSILKYTKNFFSKLKKNKHIILHNEGGAVAAAAGYYLKTKKIPCIYLQNSGLGNIVNPLFSLIHKEVYNIPILLLIGWRGSPGSKDEPQHLAQGKATLKILKLLNIESCVLENNLDLRKLDKLLKNNLKINKPVACLIKPNVLVGEKIVKKSNNKNFLKRHEVIEFIVKQKNNNLKIFSTTGYTSRELYKIRKINFQRKSDFYNVGAMGHTSMISLGYSLFSKNKKILCLDGDGSFIMHMGAVSSIGEYANSNFKHILFNNGQHESVGGQKTPTSKLDFKLLAKSCGYKRYYFAKNLNEFRKKYFTFLNKNGPSFFEVLIQPGSIHDLGRPKNFAKIKKEFQNS